MSARRTGCEPVFRNGRPSWRTLITPQLSFLLTPAFRPVPPPQLVAGAVFNGFLSLRQAVKTACVPLQHEITGLKTGVNKSVIGASGSFRASPDSLCSVACVPGRVIIRRSCPLFPPSCRDVPLGKRCAPMSGGRSRCWCFLALAHSLFIRPGRHSKEPIIFLVTTSRHFIHRKSLVIRPIAGLGQNRTGGQTGFYFRPRS